MIKGDNSIPKLIIDLELNKLTEERPKIIPKVLKCNTYNQLQTHVRGFRIFLVKIVDCISLIILQTEMSVSTLPSISPNP